MACHTPDINWFKNIDEQKKFLRKRSKMALKEYCADSELMKQCRLACFDAVTGSEIYKDADNILCYMALNDEIDLMEVMERALKEGKKVFIPRMIPDTCLMDFYRLPGDFKNRMEKEMDSHNRYRICEPSLNWEKLEIGDLTEKSLIFIPGLAFNLEGARLGRGKGFYDRFLERLESGGKNCKKAGVCFTICVTKAIPVEKTDRTVDFLLTEYGLTECVKNPEMGIFKDLKRSET